MDARARARSGDPIAIYVGDSDAFDQSITDFSQRYAATVASSGRCDPGAVPHSPLC